MTQTASSDTPPAKGRIGNLRTLWPFVRRYRGLFGGWLLALAFSSGATLAFPKAFGVMIDEGFRTGAAGAIDRVFLLMFGVAVVLALATAARFFFVSVLGERVVADLRDRLYTHLIDLDAEDYRYAVVGHPGRDYLWILSREPELDPAVYDGILARLEEQRYDTSRLVKTLQAPTAGDG